MISPAEIESAIAGANFPASKDDLLKVAERNGASEDVINELRNLDQDNFGGVTDITKALGRQG